MGKPPNLIADIGKSPNIDHEQDMIENGAPAWSGKAVYILIGLTLFVLSILVVIQHIPTNGLALLRGTDRLDDRGGRREIL